MKFDAFLLIFHTQSVGVCVRGVRAQSEPLQK